jgi:ElaB/YqjD/DUF883 family membrane-anchored ribosome-binding protein
MKSFALAPMLALAALALPLAACGGKGDDKLGSDIKEAADNRADVMEATADNMKDQADAVRDNAADQADAVDDADVNAQAMSQGEKTALVNGTEKLR